MTTHWEENLHRDFDRLRELITNMGSLTVRTLQDCVAALDNRDAELAQFVILRDQQVDLFEKDIDRLCLEFILRHQPAGAHLRFAYGALKVNFELERIGDYAESVARQLLKLADLNCSVPERLFREISTASISMLRNAVTAFVSQDANLAEATGEIEERVDALQNQINSELMHLAQSSQIPLAALSPLTTIARRFERVSDQAKSICLETLYICTGDYAKHANAKGFRVLFVDEDHGCLSRLAEALGKSLNKPEFRFASAGLEPRPVDAALAEFLGEKGLPISDSVPLALPTGGALTEYQIVIALSSGLRARLPLPGRKSVHLEWPVINPCTPAKPERARTDLEEAMRAISQKLTRLLANLVAEEHCSI